MKIGVIGSINVDLVYQLNSPLQLGETRFADTYEVLDGGKGANQAVLLKALHDSTVFLGAIGPDAMGAKAKKSLEQKALVSDVLTHDDPTGLAVIQLTKGENQIVVFPGANLTITPNDVDHFFETHPDLDFLVTQLETNHDGITYALKTAHQKGIKTVLNPAPAPETFDLELIPSIDYLIPNEHEILAIFGNVPIETVLTQYPEKVIVTLGKDGVKYASEETIIHVPAQTIDVIDTTGAGDSFIAGFVSALAQQKPLKAAVEKGIVVASLTCQRMGAQGAYAELKGESV